MNILAGADFHGDHEVYEWFVGVGASRSIDAVVLAGDLLGCPDGFASIEEAQRADAELLTKQLDRLGVPVLYIMGNDDLIEMEPSGASFLSLDLTCSRLGGYTFVGYQCSLPFMGGVFEKPEAAIAADLAEIHHLVDESTVLVTHSPAYGVLDTGLLGRSIGSTSIRDLIAARRPRAHVHGYSHAAFGRERRHFNVASARSKRAMIIDLDTMQHEVVTPARNER